LLDFTSQEDLIAWLESASAWIYNFCTPDTKSGFNTLFILYLPQADCVCVIAVSTAEFLI
jgi:hypothetical protein